MAESELANLRKQCITSLYVCTDNVSKYLDDEKDAEFDKLKSYVADYSTMEAQQKVAIDALEKARRETDSSNMDTLEERFQNHLSNLSAKRLNVSQHPFMTEYNNRVKKGLLKAQQNLNESDLAITESQDKYIDPITKKAIVDPVKNDVCGHIYEKSAILNMIKIKDRVRCPVVGCGNKGPIQEKHLISDEELKFRLAVTQHSTMIQERSYVNLDQTMEE